MKTILILCVSTAFSLPAFGQNTDISKARIVTEDIHRFWDAWDSIEPGATLQDSVGAFFEHYYLPASPGLIEFIKLRIGSVYSLVQAISRHKRYYASIRSSTLRAAEYEPEIRRAYHALDALYSDAVFPDTYVLIGRLSSGGTFMEDYLLIGAEMHGRTDEMPQTELSAWHQEVIKPIEEIPHIVVHELIHYQQKYPENERTLLGQSIREGSADFLAELLSGSHINAHVHEWANPRERELWREFSEKMEGADFSGWLYGGELEDGRPADLGYWMGYQIVASYYARIADKEEAVRGILEILDYHAFLEASGYPEKFQ